MDISFEYIRGLVDGEGSFTFHIGSKRPNGRKYKIPAFVIAMNMRDKELIKGVKDKLGIKSNICYRIPRVNIKNAKNDKLYTSGRQAILSVRDFTQLKDIIIPCFYKKLKGYKGKQFIDWLEKIGSDPDVSDRFKSLYRLYRWGIYDKDLKFTEKFKD